MASSYEYWSMTFAPSQRFTVPRSDSSAFAYTVSQRVYWVVMVEPS